MTTGNDYLITVHYNCSRSISNISKIRSDDACATKAAVQCAIGIVPGYHPVATRDTPNHYQFAIPLHRYILAAGMLCPQIGYDLSTDPEAQIKFTRCPCWSTPDAHKSQQPKYEEESKHSCFYPLDVVSRFLHIISLLVHQYRFIANTEGNFFNCLSEEH